MLPVIVNRQQLPCFSKNAGKGSYYPNPNTCFFIHYIFISLREYLFQVYFVTLFLLVIIISVVIQFVANSLMPTGTHSTYPVS